MAKSSTIAVCVPVRNAGERWKDWLKAIGSQTLMPLRVLMIDTSSSDSSVQLAEEYNLEVLSITPAKFGHGCTRQLAIDILQTDIVVFLTQDAILADRHALESLVNCFHDPDVGVAYGRQLPRTEAGLIEQHARYFNYPEHASVRVMKDREHLGMKVAFCSNSFAAYRTSMLKVIGGFPLDTIVSEDMYVATRMLQQGWKICYVADARVYHSHDYGLIEEFRRYFDIGVFNSRESWIRDLLGEAESEGGRFVKSEFRFLLKRNPLLMPVALFRTLIKLLGYRVGLVERFIPGGFKCWLSAQKWYW